MKKILIFIFTLILIVVLAFGYLYISSRPVESGNTSQETFEVLQGDSTTSIANRLESMDIIKNGFTFKILSRIKGFDGNYKVGSYALNRSMSNTDIMEILVSAENNGTMVTIQEGTTIEKIAKKLSDDGFVEENEFLKEAKSGDFDCKYVEDFEKNAERLEGFLYPDNYAISKSTSNHDIIQMMLTQYNNVFTDKYEARAKELNLSVREIMTIASIVEKEAKTPEDKKKVASVIYNRLNIDMPLQMDSILSYILKEDKIKASLEDTKVESDYNPYKNIGLPPGPICSPGKISIEAALYPDDTDYLYFVADEKLDGSNVFSTKYSEFLKDKEKFNEAYKEYIKIHPDEK